MLGNKGQVLIIFVMILPILLLILGYVIDIANIGYEKNKLTNLANLVLEEDNIVNMENIINLNDNKIDFNISEQEGKIKLELKKRIKSIFGKIIGKEFYDIKVVKENN